MTTASPANLELAIVLPLGVLANQLMKVEADLRSLSMRAGSIAGVDGGASRQVAGHVEKISETLSVRSAGYWRISRPTFSPSRSPIVTISS